jgi:hypothetical protein
VDRVQAGGLSAENVEPDGAAGVDAAVRGDVQRVERELKDPGVRFPDRLDFTAVVWSLRLSSAGVRSRPLGSSLRVG